MSKKDITVLTDVSLITCVVQRGLADDVIKAAQAAGAQGATVYYARGGGVRERLGVLGYAIEVEKEIITILVSRLIVFLSACISPAIWIPRGWGSCM